MPFLLPSSANLHETSKLPIIINMKKELHWLSHAIVAVPVASVFAVFIWWLAHLHGVEPKDWLAFAGVFAGVTFSILTSQALDWYGRRNKKKRAHDNLMRSLDGMIYALHVIQHDDPLAAYGLWKAMPAYVARFEQCFAMAGFPSHDVAQIKATHDTMFKFTAEKVGSADFDDPHAERLIRNYAANGRAPLQNLRAEASMNAFD